VLVLQSELGVLRGGGENFTRNLFHAFALRGHQVRAAFTADLRGRYPLPLPDGIEPVPLRGIWSANPGQAALARVARLLSSDGRARPVWSRVQESLSWRSYRWHCRRFQQAAARRFIGAWDRFDAVYVHGIPALAREAARHRTTVLRLPGPVPAELEPVLRSVHAVCANGDALTRIRAFLGDHVVELPIGLDLDTFSPGPSTVRAAAGWSPRDCVIGYVGRLIHLKGVDLLAAAFHRVAARAPHARLLVVGTGDQEPLLRAVLRDEIARGAVRIEPGVEHDLLPGWFRAMDLMVMPSRYENHSNALLEGMACGVPFLASDAGGNRELAAMGAGWLFEAGSETSLADALERLVGAREELLRRGTDARGAMKSHDSWAAAALRLEQIIDARTARA
jgi:glycosyltransferase involved in cell wall biosynthesis